jgi:hypothetical protein
MSEEDYRRSVNAGLRFALFSTQAGAPPKRSHDYPVSPQRGASLLRLLGRNCSNPALIDRGARQCAAHFARLWQPVVVALTAHTDHAEHARFITGGMDACLTKPLLIGGLAKILEGFPELLAQRLKARRPSPAAS